MLEADKRLKWDARFLELARFVASWSKDPSTKVGAVITDQDNRVVSVGYNSFPKGEDDDPARYADRTLKYKLIVHAERNAIEYAGRHLHGCTLYTWPFMSCSVCADRVVKSGITRCVAPVAPEDVRERWEADLELSRALFQKWGVQLDIVGVSSLPQPLTTKDEPKE